MDIDVKIT